MPKLKKARNRDKKRLKNKYGHKTDARSYLHILNRKNKERNKNVKKSVQE